jgi:hypothetical protein
MGADGDRLQALAGQMRGRVEPLAFGRQPDAVLAALEAAWGAEPVDVFIDVMPLCAVPAASDASDGIARSAKLARALLSGLRAGPAMAVMAIPHPPCGGYAALLARLDTRSRPGRVTGLGLPVGNDRWSRAGCLSAGDAVLALCHPVTRGIAGGQVIAWRPPSAPRSDARPARRPDGAESTGKAHGRKEDRWR